MRVNYLLNSGGEYLWEKQECETFKYETHPYTGLFTLTFHELRGQASHLSAAASGVIQFRVERP